MASRTSRVIRVVLGLLSTASVARAAGLDGAGVSPDVLSLPKGPGSVEGLGASFQPQLATGGGSYSVAFELPAGPAGLRPAIALGYHSGRGNGPFGVGWDIDVPKIQRRVEKGLPTYDDGDVLLGPDGEELVPQPDGTLRSRVESSYTRFRIDGSDGIVAELRDGRVQRFGRTPQARIDGAPGTFAWLLEEQVDIDGNTIRYAYRHDAGHPYLDEVRWGAPAGPFRTIKIDYEKRLDALTDARAGFLTTTNLRATELRVVSGTDVVRRYRFEYGARSTPSLLAKVTRWDASGSIQYPVAESFSYTAFGAGSAGVQDVVNPPPRALGASTELVDLDGDALPDILYTAVGDHRWQRNLGHGRFAEEQPFSSTVSATLGPHVQLADVDGDGLSDLLVEPGDGAEPQWYPNQGRGGWETPRAFAGTLPSGGFANPALRFVDLDFDKRVDVLVTTPVAYLGWKNDAGSSWVELPDAPIAEAGVEFASNGIANRNVQLVDLNGDRMRDMAVLRRGGVRWFPGTGRGQFEAGREMGGVPDLDPDAGQWRLTDLDGDGLEDLLLLAHDHLEIRLNVGGSAFDTPVEVSGTPQIDARTATRIADIDGNGTPDVVWTTSTGWKWLSLSGASTPNLLERVDNGVGRVLAMSWRSSVDEMLDAEASGVSWTTKLPMPVQILSRMTVEDQRTGTKQATEIHYRDGYYDGTEHQFRGFGRVVQREIGDASTPTLVVDTRIDVGRDEIALKGKVQSVARQTDDASPAVFDRVTTTWKIRSPAQGTRAAVAESEEREIVERGSGTPVTTRTERAWDDFGNVVVESQLGDVTTSGGAPDETVTLRRFATSPDRWILDRVAREEVQDGQGNTLSVTYQYYDDDQGNELPLGSVSRGHLVRVRGCDGPDWSEAGCAIDTQRLAYDAYGNVVTKSDAEGGSRTYQYDADFHAYPVREEIAVDDSHTLVTTAEWDTGIGKLTAHHAMDGATTLIRYDAFGRPSERIEPGDDELRPTEIYVYDVGSPLSRVITLTRQRSGEDALGTVVSCVDALGRTVQTRTQIDDRNRFLVTGETAWDARGNRRSLAEPYHATGSGCDPAPVGTPSSQVEHDALGRPVHTILPDGSETRTSYAPLTTTSWDEEDLANGSHADTPTIAHTDGRERVVSIESKLAASSVFQKFAYDARGLRTAATDATGYVTRWTYDGLGHTTRIEHPDAGAISQQFDRAGRLVQSTDARGRKVRLSYDRAGRLVTKSYADDPDSPDGSPIELHYDAPAAGRESLTGQAGKLAWVKDPSGELHLAYDARGRVSERVRVVDGKEYWFWFGYDAAGRETTRVLPDGELIGRHYDLRGELTSIDGWLDRRELDPHGGATLESWANGAASAYAYDVRGRLHTSRTIGPSGDKLADWSYTRDRVGNVTAIDDGAQPDGIDTSALVRHWELSYDDLYRLTRASADHDAAGLSYRYDDAGTMLGIDPIGAEPGSKAHAFNYGGPQPHAPVSVDGSAVSVDLSGNWLASGGRKLAWNADSMLVAVADEHGESLASYTYDFAGSRAIKRTPSETVVYVSPDYEVRGDRVTKYVFVGARRVARRDGAASLHAIADVAPIDGTDATAVRSAPDGVVDAGDAVVLLRLGAGDVRWADSALPEPDATVAQARAMLALRAAVGLPREDSADSSSKVRWLHADLLGGVSLETDEDGRATALRRFDPYGAERWTGGASDEPYGYSGKERDAESGLQYFGARYLNTGLGVWMSVDPAALGGAMAPYSLVGGRVFSAVDPDGREATSSDGITSSSSPPSWFSTAKHTVEGAVGAVQGAAETARSAYAAVRAEYEAFKQSTLGKATQAAADMQTGIGDVKSGVDNIAHGGVATKLLGVASVLDGARESAHASADMVGVLDAAKGKELNDEITKREGVLTAGAHFATSAAKAVNAVVAVKDVPGQLAKAYSKFASASPGDRLGAAMELGKSVASAAATVAGAVSSVMNAVDAGRDFVDAFGGGRAGP